MFEKIAKILVECGYAAGYNKTFNDYWIQHKEGEMCEFVVNPFADTLEGIHQADAIIDYFIHTLQIDDRYDSLWDESGACVIRYTKGAVYRIWVKERIEWCIRYKWL